MKHELGKNLFLVPMSLEFKLGNINIQTLIKCKRKDTGTEIIKIKQIATLFNNTFIIQLRININISRYKLILIATLLTSTWIRKLYLIIVILSI